MILTGGKSLRMGREKALIEIHGIPMAARLADLLAFVTDEILISSDNRAALEQFGHPVVPDLFPGQGPLAGLHAALKHTRRPLMLLLACDLPRLHGDLLRALLAAAHGFDAVVPRTSDGRAHPLCALYRRTCAGPAEERLVRGENKMIAFLEDPALRVCWLSPKAGSFHDEDLVNLNSPKDLEEFIK